MRIAKDINGVYCWVTSKKVGFCPVCGDELVIKEGSVISAYYSHTKNPNCVTATGVMSEWHLIWQSKFERTEVFTEDRKFRADAVLDSGIVIEFQSSPMTAAEIRKRESAYKKMIWLFNVIDKMQFKGKKVIWDLPNEWLYHLSTAFWHVKNDSIISIKNLDFEYSSDKYRTHKRTLIADYNLYTPDEWINLVKNIK